MRGWCLGISGLGLGLVCSGDWPGGPTPRSRDTDRVGVAYVWFSKPPAGYTGVLTIDYVPPSLNWAGPSVYVVDLTQSAGGIYLPCPITDDPYNPDNVTRMHLTVYTYPIPEPSSLAALGLALAGVGIGVARRRTQPRE